MKSLRSYILILTSLLFIEAAWAMVSVEEKPGQILSEKESHSNVIDAITPGYMIRIASVDYVFSGAGARIFDAHGKLTTSNILRLGTRVRFSSVLENGRKRIREIWIQP